MSSPVLKSAGWSRVFFAGGCAIPRKVKGTSDILHVKLRVLLNESNLVFIN
jgi:hypothetical protein